MKKVVVTLCLVVLASAKPMAKEEGVMEKFLSAIRDCLEADTMLCLKEKAMKYSENLANAKELSVSEGISFSKTGGSRSARSYEPLSEDPKTREVQIEDRILDNVVDFMDNHVLQLRMPKSLTEDDNSIEEEGRGKKKKKLKKLLPILALIKLKLAALVPLFLGIIAFAVFKAYILGKIAFLAAALQAIKKLLESKKSSGWSEPSHDDHGWESNSGWGRSQDAQNLAYSGHAKQA